ncbi:hypothetical protein EVAR_88148_1 [Eumeta japonica]|uniref:Uncharacterized protein n=1 Tax=Eumeta variegata TaxID=151549 RepID=A0A4C1WT29_EUMVA|nr:hypothetical protein EVAR_88148_1 [Eumeta japonica]
MEPEAWPAWTNKYTLLAALASAPVSIPSPPHYLIIGYIVGKRAYEPPQHLVANAHQHSHPWTRCRTSWIGIEYPMNLGMGR